MGGNDPGAIENLTYVRPNLATYQLTGIFNSITVRGIKLLTAIKLRNENAKN